MIDGSINRDLFDRHVEIQLAPTLQPGDVIILDNLFSYRSLGTAQILTDIGAWFLALPPYSPDLNPIEINKAFTRTRGVHALIFAKLDQGPVQAAL